MIHEEDDDPTIDFSWFYFIGRTKLNLTFKETGRLSLVMFNILYGHYKSNFDLEMRLWHANMTYADLAEKKERDEDWF